MTNDVVIVVNQIIHCDALTKLKEIESESVDCIVTSPPYYNLRDYKVHGQIGTEKTIDEYIANLLAIFSECRRVLKSSGTFWLVIGDRLEEKSLQMIPERLAIKLTAETKFYLRNKIIWHKRNCMPSSEKTRFTIDYEFIYFFTKSPKNYYFKTQYEPHITLSNKTMPPIGGVKHLNNGNPTYSGNTPYYNRMGRIKRCVWTINTEHFKEAHFAVFPEELVKQCIDAGCPEEGIVLDPFMGSGTTALVALKTNRKFIGIELNQDYIEIANKRINPYLKQQKLSTI